MVIFFFVGVCQWHLQLNFSEDIKLRKKVQFLNFEAFTVRSVRLGMFYHYLRKKFAFADVYRRDHCKTMQNKFEKSWKIQKKLLELIILSKTLSWSLKKRENQNFCPLDKAKAGLKNMYGVCYTKKL